MLKPEKVSFVIIIFNTLRYQLQPNQFHVMFQITLITYHCCLRNKLRVCVY